ncbi:MAG TPA: hypothetical protein DIU07_09360 [Rhodobacteraceae bacterium]|nr:hypothetical protein [Paracoccaceae bacterium]
MKSVLIGFAVLSVLAVVVVLLLANGFSRQIARAEARLAAYPSGALRTDLPPEVQAFAERGMAGDTPGVAIALAQAAEMRLKRGANWTALSARQTISSPVPGFAWVAQMKVGPIPVVRVIDSLVEGAGRLEVRALGAFRIGAESGPEAALGEAQRYLAELPWTPDAILTNRAIAWADTPEGVTARLETEGGPAEIRFTFDAAGDIATARAEDRPAKLADGTPARLVWRGWFKDYAKIGGRRIPLQGEVGYQYPDGFESYWRGRVTGYEVIGADR